MHDTCKNTHGYRMKGYPLHHHSACYKTLLLCCSFLGSEYIFYPNIIERGSRDLNYLPNNANITNGAQLEPFNFKFPPYGKLSSALRTNITNYLGKFTQMC